MLYDLSELRKFSRGDLEFELDMIQTFIDEAEEYSGKMRSLYQKNELSGVAAFAHKFKSTADVFLMKELRALLDEIENKSKSFKLSDDLQNLLNSLDQLSLKLIEMMNQEKVKYCA
jgi:HPt (histidine-containing phosphotransfer) domain-containing protein